VPARLDAAGTGVRTAVEIQSRIAQARVQLHLPQGQVHLVDIELAVADLDLPRQARRPGAAGQLDIRVECPAARSMSGT